MTHFDRSLQRPAAAEIVRSVGDVTYEWRLDTDVLSWIGIEMAEIANGPRFRAARRGCLRRIIDR
ncbi:MAG TPA: hypothetical protein VEH02_10790 [Pseudolabrys sp.]|nr:hypothetical protein [Pseudolabrys sp.]